MYIWLAFWAAFHRLSCPPQSLVSDPHNEEVANTYKCNTARCSTKRSSIGQKPLPQVAVSYMHMWPFFMISFIIWIKTPTPPPPSPPPPPRA